MLMLKYKTFEVITAVRRISERENGENTSDEATHEEDNNRLDYNNENDQGQQRAIETGWRRMQKRAYIAPNLRERSKGIREIEIPITNINTMVSVSFSDNVDAVLYSYR